MNIALWAVQVILTLIFFMAGFTKAFRFEKAKSSMPWVNEYSKGFVTFVGAAELLGGIGLVVPGFLEIQPNLTPLAAVGLAIIMLLATIFHVKRKEYTGIPMTVILLLFSLFIAIGRFYILPL